MPERHRLFATLSNQKLALGELEPLAGAGLTGLFTFFHTRIAGEHAFDLEGRAMSRVELEQCTGDSEANCASLTVRAATIGVGVNVEGRVGLGERQRSQNLVLQGGGREILFEGFAVHFDFTAAGNKADAGDSRFAASGGVVSSRGHNFRN